MNIKEAILVLALSRYEDAEAEGAAKFLCQEVTRLETENKRLEAWIDDLQSGLYINCVYCGHRYPPGSPAIRSKTLYNHIKQCPKHPLSKAEEENKRLRDLLKKKGRSDGAT